MHEPPTEIQFFAEVYDHHPQAVVWLKPLFAADQNTPVDFEFSYCNEEGLKYLGITRKQQKILRVSTTPTLADALRNGVLQELIAVYQTGVVSETNIYNSALNKYARVLRSKLRGGVLTVLQDRTEERQIIHQLEEKSRELEEKTREMQAQKTLLDNVLANSSNGISVSRVFRNDSGTITDAQTIMANDAAVRYIGLPREIYLTKRATEIEPAVMTSPYYQACIKTLETGEPFVMQYRMESTGRWLELTVSKLDYDHLIQVFTDVTPMKEAQLKLEEAAHTLHTVFDAAQTGMFTFAPLYDETGEITDFRFVMVNKTIADYAGKQREELEGQPGVKWFPGYLKNGEFDLYKRCFQTGEPQRKEIHFNEGDRDFFLDLQSMKIGNQLLVTITDQSNLRNSQQQLEKLVEELKRSNKSLEEFAHAASHDLKEPIRKISVFSGQLKSSLVSRLNERELSMFNRIQAATERMTQLVDDLLMFSHVSMNPLQMEAVDLNKKIQLVLIDLEVTLEEKGAVVTVEPLPVVWGYRRQLQQLFQNLISNAVKYTKPNTVPRVTVRATEVTGSDVFPQRSLPGLFHRYYLVEVADNGIGFESSQAEQIFELFHRLHGRSEYTGTGIGLSIARKVVENHQGYIWADSQPGHGATFKVLLPIRDVHNADRETNAGRILANLQ